MKPDRSVAPSAPDLARELTPSTPAHGFPGLKSSDRAPHEVILHRAYEIWESEGHPTDRKLENWLEAEAEVMSRL